MTYELRGNQIFEHGTATHLVAEIPDGVDREAAFRLIGSANLAERDEELLNQIGERITTRNET